ncbi:hypothetical protein GEMRC1_007087 [Eukaryota sp. GEM-RC1]
MQLLIFYGLVATLTSFICSLLEASFLSLDTTFIEGERQNESNNKRRKTLAETAHHMQQNQNRPLAAILTCNTIANTIGATGFGAEVELLWPGERFYGVPASVVAAALFTLIVLLFAEILPKTLGALYYKSCLGLTVRTIQFLTVLVYPMVWICDKLAKMFPMPAPASVSRDELFTMVQKCSDGGEMSEKEVGIIRHLFCLRTIKVADICTPRTVITGFPAHYTVKQALETKAFIQFSRIPVFRSFPDDCIGYVLSSSLLNKAAVGEYQTCVTGFTRDLHPISEHLSVAEATEKFLDTKQHMMRVIGEFEETVGLITLEDCLETLLGVEVVDEMDVVVDLRDYAKRVAKDRSSRLADATIGMPFHSEESEKVKEGVSDECRRDSIAGVLSLRRGSTVENENDDHVYQFKSNEK